MAMTNEELLAKVKIGLDITGTHSDGNLLIKTIAVKEFIINAGVTTDQLESSLGIATLTIGVSDLWNTVSGEIKMSDAFMYILLPQLMVVSIEDE